MKSTLLVLLFILALTTARIPSHQQEEDDVVTSILATSQSLSFQNPMSKASRDTERIQLDLCDCQPAYGEPGGLSCDKEGFFIASFEREGSWVAGGGQVPLSRAVCCRPCLPTDLPDDSPLFDDGDKPLALVSLGCHTSTDPLGVRCEADNNANSFISGFTSAVHVFSAVDTQYPVNTAQCCTPALLMESGNAWELERCDCGASTDPEHSVSCSSSSGGGSIGGGSSSISSGGSGGGGDDKNSSIVLGSILSGFDFFRISPVGQIVPIGPAKCCGVCLTGKIHPAADCRDLNHCSGNGVCLLARCECLQGWGSPDCSQSLAGKGGWGGKIPPWAISLIVIFSCLLTMVIISAAAHVAELIFESRRNRRGGSDTDDEDGDGSRRPLLLRIDADDAGSVGSQDTEGLGECDDDEENGILLGGVEERIEQVIHRLEQQEPAPSSTQDQDTAREGGDDVDEREEVISDGEEDREEADLGAAAGSSVPSSSSLGRERGQTLASQVRATSTSTSNSTEEEETTETTPAINTTTSMTTTREEEEQGATQDPEKPAASTNLQSYMGIGPLSNVDCVVCMIRPVQTVVIPCGHVCMCRRCSRRLTRCPVCRKDVVRRQRLFV